MKMKSMSVLLGLLLLCCLSFNAYAVESSVKPNAPIIGTIQLAQGNCFAQCKDSHDTCLTNCSTKCKTDSDANCGATCNNSCQANLPTCIRNCRSGIAG